MGGIDVGLYLKRIGHEGPVGPNLATLRALHRGHLLAIPYENFDVLFGRPMTTDPLAAFDKIVRGGRGGWCYEMNGTLGAVLDEIGFDVTRLAGAVRRDERGEKADGNHLVLRVDLPEGPYIADVGFGDGVLEPIPLAVGDYNVAGYDFRLERLDDDWLRFHNHLHGGAPNFDFTLEPAAPEVLGAMCRWLSTSEESVFTQTAIAQRHTPGRLNILLGRLLRRVTPNGRTQTLLTSPDQLVDALARDFDLDLPEAADLWPAICARHELFFAGPEEGVGA